ncbi:RNA polymerase sigma factor [Actinomadura soli]|uniref:RNA polymerase sigma factor n=1 Tax=Actinomadura soli TaxID=2508997 RepID=A0A5C4JCR4_9ACTN|nr:RNA polymerase sigma factor [Actinomadura soli]TMR01252.1 RNA polymerase sigma factor [Actinomadura soli]
MTAESATGPRQDSELIAESLSRPEVFGELFDRYFKVLSRYAVRRLGVEAAEDVVGETFLVAFSRRQHYDLSYDDARPWLFGIVTKLIARHRRTEAARYRALERSPAERDVAGPADRVAAEVTAKAAGSLLARALGELARRDRDVLLLVAWGDLTYAEVAQALDISVGTVGSRLNRARRRVREFLGDLDLVEERHG